MYIYIYIYARCTRPSLLKLFDQIWVGLLFSHRKAAMILSHIHYPPQSPVVSTEMIKMDLLPALTARISSGGSYQRAFTQRPGITKESGDDWWQKWWRNTHRLQRCVFISTFAGYKKPSMFVKPWKAHPCVLAQRIVWHLFVHILASQIRIFQKSLTWEWVCHTVCDWKPWYWWTASPPFNMVLSLPPMLNTPQSNPWFGTVHLGDIKHGLLDNSPLCRWFSHCLHIHNLGSIDIEDGKLTIPNYWIVVCYLYILYNYISMHIYIYIYIGNRYESYIFTAFHKPKPPGGLARHSRSVQRWTRRISVPNGLTQA